MKECLIVLAKNIEGENSHLVLMDITVKRNAYGKQIDSFSTKTVIEKVSPIPIPLVFIRAENNVELLCKIEGYITAARQDNMLVTSFHPELTNDLTIRKYFLNMILK